ncbi:MAG: hypothetical protein ACTSVG_00780 [Alphaproteobacteria bacterium]
MKKLLGAIAITAAALAATSVFAETTAEDQHERFAVLRDQDKPVTESRAVSSVTGFTGITSVLRFDTIAPWSGNYAAGRIHPPAGH